MSQQLELLTESPSQWASVMLLSPEIQKKEIKPFVVLALKELEGNPDSRTSSLMSVDKFSAVRAVVRHVARLRGANGGPWSADDVTVFLEGLRFNADCVTELTSLLCMDKVYENIPRHLRVKPGLVSLQWKVDISLSQSTISSEKASGARARDLMRQHTHVVLLLRLTDGRTQSYRLSIAKFHELRYCIASALKSLLVLQRRNCMRRD